jgi:hypothetical protein
MVAAESPGATPIKQYGHSICSFYVLFFGGQKVIDMVE